MSSLSVSCLVDSSPFPDYNTFENCMKLLDVADIGRVARVCKSWNKLVQSPDIWKNLFEKEGIPLVTSLNGEPRNYSEDFKTLYPITISGKRISRLFGEMIGQVPPISEKWVLKLQEEDPFEKEKSIGENYVFVVVPSFLVRTVDQETPLALEESGNLIESNTETSMLKHDLTISFSLKNLKILCSYPLRGKENMPVFDKDSPAKIFNECNTSPDKVRVYFMRKHVTEQSRKMSYANQENLVRSQGFEVTPLRERFLFNATRILESGTCPDGRNPSTYARNSDIVHYGNVIYQSVVGGFAPRGGVRVDGGYDDSERTGVVPGAPAEVLRSSALDHLAFDKGH